MTKVLVAGATGKVGREVCLGVKDEDDLKLTGAVALDLPDKDFATSLRIDETVVMANEIEAGLKQSGAEVMVDFTHPDAVLKHIETALALGVHCVIGTTGLAQDELDEVSRMTEETGANVIIAPNFALGAILMMKCSELASKYFAWAEIIELHHDGKADAPSGTALKTASGMAGARREKPLAPAAENIAGARGGEVEGYRIHSVRLPGLMAHQEVIFGGPGQILTIRHDAMDRSCYVPGVILAVREVGTRRGLTFGLDKLLD